MKGISWPSLFGLRTKPSYLWNITRNFSSMSTPKTAILMMNMGGPSSEGEVQEFLTRLFTDEDIIPLPSQSILGPFIAKRRTPKITEKYKEIGGGSPIRQWTDTQGSLLVKELNTLSAQTAPHKHYIGFRYAHPLTEEALDQMAIDGVKRIVAFSQYPQYSCSTTGSSLNLLAKLLQDHPLREAHWSIIDRWPSHPGLAKVFAHLIREELKKFPEDIRSNVVILFSAHSLPLKVVGKGDPYPTEVGSTVLQVMGELNFSHPYRLVWQSKVGPLPWLSPSTQDAMKGLVEKGHKHQLMVPITFVNEHIETLHEMDIEYGKEFGKEIGIGHFRRVSAPNDHPLFIKTLADIVQVHLASNQPFQPQLKLQCPLCTKESCKATRSWLDRLQLQTHV